MGNIVVRPTFSEFDSYLLARAFLNGNSQQDKQNTNLIRLQCRDEIHALLERSESQKQLIEGVKTIWHKLKVTKRKLRRPGRPTSRDRVNAEIEGWYKDHNRDDTLERATDGQLFRHVRSKYPPHQLHKNTIEKYVKFWRLLRTPPWDRSVADWKWLNRREPSFAQMELETITNLHARFPLSLSLKLAKKRITAARTLC